MSTLFLFGMPGGTELIVIIFVVLLLFGGRKIPELMRGLGQGIREFNRAEPQLNMRSSRVSKKRIVRKSRRSLKNLLRKQIRKFNNFRSGIIT
ncbi:MAG: twin-arginine translocase TatA/TatE family subunit [Saprospiraceae bacterium]|nr:twin-arginine translocase TatA/TatE family subunit [Saprospiraceae bacterium]